MHIFNTLHIYKQDKQLPKKRNPVLLNCKDLEVFKQGAADLDLFLT